MTFISKSAHKKTVGKSDHQATKLYKVIIMLGIKAFCLLNILNFAT